MGSKKLDLGDGDLEDVVGALLEIDETGGLGDERKRRLVKLAEKSAAEVQERCTVAVFLNGTLERCSLHRGHRGNCSLRIVTVNAEAEKPVESGLGSLDDLLEWVPDPGPIREEILEILAGLPGLAELDRVAELVGRLAALVNAPGGK